MTLLLLQNESISLFYEVIFALLLSKTLQVESSFVLVVYRYQVHVHGVLYSSMFLLPLNFGKIKNINENDGNMNKTKKCEER